MNYLDAQRQLIDVARDAHARGWVPATSGNFSARLDDGDIAITVSGKDKGKKGSVLKVVPSSRRVLVQGVNMVKRHTRPSAASPGGIIEMEAMLHVSNVAHIDPKQDKPTRVGYRILENGRKVRYAKLSGEVIDV